MNQHEKDRLRIEALEREIDELHERIRQLEEDRLGADWVAPIELGLTSHEERVLAVLLRRQGVVSKEMMMDALYGLLPGDSEPEIKIVDVYVCKIRKKVAPFGLKIETHRGRGYFLDAASRQQLAEWSGALPGEAAA